MSVHIELDQEKIAEFCRRWKITEFALFGSVLRKDLPPLIKAIEPFVPPPDET